MRTASQANTRNYQAGPLTPEQQQIRDAFRAEEYLRDQMDVQEGRIWDSLSFEAGDVFHQELELFTKISGKTFAESSMTAPGYLMNPEAFAIRRVLFSFSRAATEYDIYSIAEGFTWIFGMGRKRYLNSPIISLQTVDLPKAPIRICDYCRAVYVAEHCPGCGARQFTLSSLGGGEAGRAFAMDVGITLVIEHEITFWVRFAGREHTLRAPLKLWCHFEGLHARGIQ
jgi:hypothetical protein